MIEVTVFEYEGVINIDVGKSSYDISVEEIGIAMDYDWYSIFADELGALESHEQEAIVAQIIEGIQTVPNQYRDLF